MKSSYEKATVFLPLVVMTMLWSRPVLAVSASVSFGFAQKILDLANDGLILATAFAVFGFGYQLVATFNERSSGGGMGKVVGSFMVAVALGGLTGLSAGIDAFGIEGAMI